MDPSPLASTPFSGDEAAWPGDKRGIDKLKSYITEEYVSIERKNVPAFEIENHARFIFATNRVHSAPAEIDDRRFVVLPVDEGKRSNDAYWEALTAEQNSNGPAALLHHLLHEAKITRNLRSVPKTVAHAEQKLFSLDSVGTFWRWALQTQYPHAGIKEQERRFQFGSVAAPTEVWEVYRLWCRDSAERFPMPPDAFGRALKKYAGDLRKREARVDERREYGIAPRGRVYELPALDEARRLFEAALGGVRLEWDGDGAWDAPVE